MKLIIAIESSNGKKEGLMNKSYYDKGKGVQCFSLFSLSGCYYSLVKRSIADISKKLRTFTFETDIFFLSINNSILELSSICWV